ncbi:MAG: hypothetical protein WB014_06100 [Methanosarcina sp.]
MARKTKLTLEIIEVTKENIKLGMSYSSAAASVGVTYETWNNWVKLGRKGKSPYASFYAAIQESEANLMRDCLTQLRKAVSMGNLESIKFLLERRFPQEWGKKDNISIQARSENVNFNVNQKLKQEEAERIRQDILAKLARPVYDAGNRNC